MSLASSKTALTPNPQFDLDYSIHDFPIDTRPDTKYLFRRIDEVMVETAAMPGGRTLDVACGIGKLAQLLQERGNQVWGIDPSQEMLGLSRWVFPNKQIVLARGIAEVLPFRDRCFDRVVCQGSLDHFVDPDAFMSEAARILRPDGRLVVALANYESLACRIGRRRDGGRAGPDGERPYWQPPPDHHHKGDLAFVRALGGGRLRLERSFGVSLLWLVKDWDMQLARLPRSLADALLVALDKIAYLRPSMADMIISVWRPQ